MYDIQKVRADFPILGRKVYDRPLVYLDNAATTQKPRCVVEAMTDEYYNVNANVHRGVHYLSQQATDLHEAARETVRRFINARSADEVIFTRGTTESANLVASSFVEAFMSPGDEVIVSVMEHHSNIVPWQLEAARHGIAIRVIPMHDDGTLDMEAYARLFSPRTKLVSVTHVSNVLGTVNPVADIIAIAHSHDIPVMVDGAQSTPHFAVDVQQLDCEFFTFSGHKIYGPTGIGVLYGKSELLEAMSPWLGGGKMVHEVSFDGFTTQSAPWKLEAGTPNVAGVIGLSAALEWLADYDINQAESWSRSLATLAEDALTKRPGFRSFRCQDSSLLAFDFAGVHHSDMVTLLAEYGIALRAGQHCAQPLLAELGVTGTLRASFAPYNTKSDVDALVNAVDRALELLVD